jgi:hypothetical protein
MPKDPTNFLGVDARKRILRLVKLLSCDFWFRGGRAAHVMRSLGSKQELVIATWFLVKWSCPTILLLVGLVRGTCQALSPVLYVLEAECVEVDHQTSHQVVTYPRD